MPDTRPAIVLLHSSLSSRRQWTTQMAEQEANYRFIAIDLLMVAPAIANE